MKVSITIPTIKDEYGILKQKNDILKAVDNEHTYDIYFSCKKVSTPVNRNSCIDNTSGDIIIMLDDDVTGYYFGCFSELIAPLCAFPDKYSIMAARYLRKDGSIGPQLGNGGVYATNGKDVQKAIHSPETGLNLVGSACIAFYRDDTRFDENYISGGAYEDTDFCMQINKKYPDKIIAINNRCKLIHNCEGKGRGSSPGKHDNWLHNRSYFNKKWSLHI